MLRLVAFGDSIANGLGAQGKSYPVLLAQRLGARLIDLTGSAIQVNNALDLREGAKGADIAVIAFGITEAMIRPTNKALKLLPRRWRRAGWTDPRPYYSSRRWKRAIQMVESGVRWRIKVALIRLTGGARWGSPKTYERDLTELVEYLQATGISIIVIVGYFGHDERFFPGSTASCDEFLTINRGVASTTGTLFLDGTSICRQWEDFLCDHFHPNVSGHRRVADHLLSLLSAQSSACIDLLPTKLT